jgi:D-alanyl-D-alanine carboxypeptidase (penicillin-binding protein 5/6)
LKRVSLGIAIIAACSLGAAGAAPLPADNGGTTIAPAPPPRMANPVVRTHGAALPAPVPDDVPVALLVDLSTGQTLYAREENRRFVPASVTKVMTAYTAFKLVHEGHLNPDKQVVISPELQKKWWNEGSTMFLKAGDRVTIGQLLLGITTVSANDAAVVVSQEAVGSTDAWLRLMNANAQELGMRDTHFGTPNGWPDEGRTFTSARDLAILGEALVVRFPDLYHRFFGHRGMTYQNISQSNHDPVTGVVDGADGIKTGYTRQAGYNFLGSAERGGRRLIMVIAAAPTAPIRDKTARDLLRWGFDSFSTRTVLPGATSVGQAQVQDGDAATVQLVTGPPVLASVPMGQEDNLKLSIRYRGPVAAPIRKGQRVAWLYVESPGHPPHNIPLLAAQDVAQANLLQRLVNGVAGMFT